MRRREWRGASCGPLQERRLEPAIQPSRIRLYPLYARPTSVLCPWESKPRLGQRLGAQGGRPSRARRIWRQQPQSLHRRRRRRVGATGLQARL